MILHVKDAKYIGDYKVDVTFNDGRRGVADLSDALHGPVFEPLKDKTMFSRLRIDNVLETITWPNGADLAPEYLYFLALRNVAELRETFRKWGYIA